MSAISVIIINYNSGAERLARCLAALDAQIFRDFKIIVLDNASEDGSSDSIAETDTLRLIRSETNLGFAAGVNRAAREAKGAWLALLNPDTEADPDWLAKLMTATSRYPDVPAFGSVQIDAKDKNLLDGLGDVYHATGIAWRGGFGQSIGWRPEEDMEIFAPCAAACLYRRDLFEELGGFAEEFFCYHEDVDFGMRLRLAGHAAVLVHDAVIHHEGSGVTGRRSVFTVYHGTRNRIWTFIRTVPSPLFWLLLPLHIGVNKLFLLRAIFMGHGDAYFRGMWDGFLKGRTAWQQRKEVQKQRTITTRTLSDAMTWSLGKLLTRAPDMRHLPQDANSAADRL